MANKKINRLSQKKFSKPSKTELMFEGSGFALEGLVSVLEGFKPVSGGLNFDLADFKPMSAVISLMSLDFIPVLKDIALMSEGFKPMFEDIAPEIEDIKPGFEGLKNEFEDINAMSEGIIQYLRLLKKILIQKIFLLNVSVILKLFFNEKVN